MQREVLVRVTGAAVAAAAAAAVVAAVPTGSPARRPEEILAAAGAVAATTHRPSTGTATGTSRGPSPGRVDTPQRLAETIAAGRLLVIGASYTAGWGATRPADDYAALVAHRLRRPLTINAVPGTGFVNPGRLREGTFAQRLTRIPTAIDPRIVLIQGGRDDTADPEREYRAVRATVELARHRFVHAQVVILGPVPAKVPVYRSLLATRDAIARAARDAGAGFVDPIAQHWITRSDEEGYQGRIPGHPNDRGYAYIAARLVTDLPAALRASADPLDPTDDPHSDAAERARADEAADAARRVTPASALPFGPADAFLPAGAGASS